MVDFRLQVFVSAARNLSFTKAARELYISQPAVSKHIQELESESRVALFTRAGGRIALTPEGVILLRHAETIIDQYRAMQLEMNLLSGNFSGTLRVGASTTIAQYMLSPILAGFVARFPEIRLELLTGNSEYIEQSLENHTIDVGLVEGVTRRQGIKYTHFAKDELVLVTNVHTRTEDEIAPQRLTTLPLLLREIGSGTLDVIERTLNAHHIKLSKLSILLHLGSNEGIKGFLANSTSAYAIVPIISISNNLLNNKLKVIDIEGVTFEREFAFATMQGIHDELVDKFVIFANMVHNQKL